MKKNWKMVKNFIFFLKRMAVLLAMGLLLPSLRVHAENASVTFGSAEYTPQEDTVFQVGVYFQCDYPDFVYDATLQYDASIMEYLGGADAGGDGIVQFAGEASGGERQYMLSFRALTEGDGTVHIAEASVITDPAVRQGEVAMGADEAEQMAPVVADIIELGRASVNVNPAIDCSLSELSIAELPDFKLESGVHEYELMVPADVQKLDIQALALDSRAFVEISDTSLQTGDNTITITVRGDGNSEQYNLHVLRQDTSAMLDTAAVPEEATVAQPVTQENAEIEAAPVETETALETMGLAQNQNKGNEMPFSERLEKTLAQNPEYICLIAVGAVICFTFITIFSVRLLWRQKRKNDFYDEADEADEADWIDLTTDEKWLHWLNEIEEEEMDTVFIWANLRESSKNPREQEHGGAKGQIPYSSENVTEWVEQKNAGRKDIPSIQPEKPGLIKTESVEEKEKKSKKTNFQALNAIGAEVQKRNIRKRAIVEILPDSEDEETPASEKKTEAKITTVQAPPVIRINDVSMRFKINEVNAGSLKEYLLATVKRQNKYHELEALKHISFDIMQGEIVGIIGTNGSGKSTLLKLIAGVLNPSEGNIEVDHRKVQLLTLGTGFDAELTARENVYLNGAIIGYSKEFIDENYENIVQFAELEGFMDEKIKNFSSGMKSRLGFAIATAGKTAEILILDEVLSVGDMFFKQKSEKRIKEMIHSGATVLIVSHSTDTIIKNCSRAVWIEKGVLMEIGEPKKVCASYRKMSG